MQSWSSAKQSGKTFWTASFSSSPKMIGKESGISVTQQKDQ